MSRAPHVYYETRTMHTFGPPTPIASDIARHLQSRQFLGITVVVCANPFSMLSALRKQWLRLTRNLQKQRASTLNAEEILRFTHTIMHMQHLQFVAQVPVLGGEGHIYFVTPDELQSLPPGCVSLYITTAPRTGQLRSWLESLAPDALVIGYDATLGLSNFNLEPKKALEQRMLADWHDLQHFMANNDVDVQALQAGFSFHSAAMDDALDSLLSCGSEFLHKAAAFQHIVSLSQPLKNVPATMLKQFETTMRLAHRVQSLTPGNFSGFLVREFGERHADSFFLRDAAPEEDELLQEEIQETLTFYSMEGVRFTTEYI